MRQMRHHPPASWAPAQMPPTPSQAAIDCTHINNTGGMRGGDRAKGARGTGLRGHSNLVSTGTGTGAKVKVPDVLKDMLGVATN